MTPAMREALHLIAEHPGQAVVHRVEGVRTERYPEGTVLVNRRTVRGLLDRGLVQLVAKGQMGDVARDADLELTDTGAEELARQLGDR